MAREKKVFSDISQVAHLWANKLQGEARNSGNYYFYGNTIYSYGRHFPIAKHINDNTVLFTVRTYSNTTSKHIWTTRHACSHKNRIYCYTIAEYNQECVHSENMQYWERAIEEQLKKLQRARKPHLYIDEAIRLKFEAEKYCEYYNIAFSSTLESLTDDLSYENYLKVNEEREIRIIKDKLEAVKKAKLSFKKNIKDWLSGETSSFYTRLNYDFLRVEDDFIRSTQNVKIPLSIAKAFHKLVKEDKLKVGDKILQYTVNEVGSIIKIGCHTFRKTYLIKFGDKL